MKLEGRKTTARLQTQLEKPVALVQVGELTQDASTTLSATYKGEAGTAVSNAWAISLKDKGDNTKTFLGDQRAKIICTETQQSVTPDKPNFGTYAWGETSRDAQGNLVGGKAEEGFSDVIYGTSGNDTQSGGSSIALERSDDVVAAYLIAMCAYPMGAGWHFCLKNRRTVANNDSWRVAA